MRRTFVEVIGTTVDDCVIAANFGADRIELCSAMELGGLTPTLGTLIEARWRVKIPIIAMLRPRSGGFCYSDSEFETMLVDSHRLLGYGADGLAVGILQLNGKLDLKRMETIRKRIGLQQAVCHRAFDVTPDPFRALDELIDLGFTRVLTSGQKRTAPEGIGLIRELINHANGRIEILPGSGIRPTNARQFVLDSNATAIHLSIFEERHDDSARGNPGINFNRHGIPENTYTVIDGDALEAMVVDLNGPQYSIVARERDLKPRPGSIS